MSEEKITTLYKIDTLAQTKIQDQQIRKIKALGEDCSNNYYFYLMNERKNCDILKICDDGNNNYTTEVMIHQLPGKPLALDQDSNEILIQQNNTLGLMKTNTNALKNFAIQFQAQYSLPIKPINAHLLLNKQKDMTIYIKQTSQFSQPLSLLRILQPYSLIHKVSHLNDYIAFGCYVSQLKQYHILIITLKNNAEGRPQFTLIDTIKLKQNTILNHIQLIEEGKQILYTYNGSKIIKSSVNHSFEAQYRRNEMKIMHNFNFYKVKSLNLIDNRKDLLVQDSTKHLYLFKIQKSQELNNVINKLFSYSLSKNAQICQFSDQIFVIGFNEFDKTQVLIQAVTLFPINDAVKYFLEDKEDILTAKTIIRRTGEGKSRYLEWQNRQNGFSDLSLLQEYLSSQNNDDIDSLIHLLKNQKINSIQGYEIILMKVLEIAEKKKDCDCQKIRDIYFAQNRLTLYKMKQNPDIDINQFTFDLSIENLITKLIQKSQSTETSDIKETIKDIFHTLELEIIYNYHSVMENIPLECLDPQFLLKYLPPGYIHKRNSFWQRYLLILADQEDQQEIIDILTDNEIYHMIANEYIYQLNQPDKALIILQEAAQNRQIQGLTRIAIEVVEHSLISNVELKSHEQRVGDLFGLSLSLSDSLQSIEVNYYTVIMLQLIQTYFNNSKWIFMMDQQLYKRYLNDIKYFLTELVGVEDSPLLLYIFQRHGDSFLFLRDEDLSQIALDIIYERLTTKNSEQVFNYYLKLQEMTLNQNQSAFIARYLQNHSHIQKDLLSKYDVQITFRELLKLQMNNQNDTYTHEVSDLCQQVLDSQIKKSKKVKDKLQIFSMSSDSKWITLLEDLLQIRSDLGYSEKRVDVYTIFISKLLENKVTQSVEQLLRSDIIPIDDVQISVLKYFQDQYNHCLPENFYQFGQNSKQFMELIRAWDVSKIHFSKINQELKLLEVSFYLRQNELLMLIPYHQIRSDFMQDRLLDRVLQVHGFQNYPDNFEILEEIQAIIDRDNICQVTVKVLRHLNTIRLFESDDNFPDYLYDMISKEILQRSTANFNWINDIGEILMKIALNSHNLRFKKKLLRLMTFHINKKLDLYYEICRELIRLINRPLDNNLISDIKIACNEGMTSKAKSLIKRFQREKQVADTLETYIQLIQEGELKHEERVKLAKIIGLDNEVKDKIKKLSNFDNESLIQLLKDQNKYDEHISGQTQRTIKKESFKAAQIDEFYDAIDVASLNAQPLQNEQQVQKSSIERLNESNDEDEIKMILDMDYSSGWDSSINVDKIISDMKEKGISCLSYTVMTIIIDKLNDNIEYANVPIQKFKTALDQDDKINYLLFIQDLAKNQNEKAFIDQMISLMFMPNDQNPILSEIQRLVNDANLLQLSVIFEELDQRYSLLCAIVLYSMKLKLFGDNQQYIKKSSDILKFFYNFIDKEILKDLIEDSVVFRDINAAFRQYIKSKKINEISEDKLVNMMIN